MATIPFFNGNSYAFDAPAEIISRGTDERGTYLILNKTIFHPQGGGQPSDVGTIECGEASFTVTSVRKMGDEVRHYVEGECAEDLNGIDCLCVLDRAARTLHMRYHSAGHLLSNIAESIYPGMTAVKAHCFPNGAYVEFQGEGTCERDTIEAAVGDAVKSDLPITVFEVNGEEFERKFYKLPYQVPPRETFRVVQIGQHKPIPCGGTHLSSTVEIGNFEIAKIKNKNGSLRIPFAIGQKIQGR
jgi:alanyl-tRNA synthetase